MVIISVSKESVMKVRAGLYRIVLKMVVMEEEITLIDQDFSQYYRTGDVPATVVNRFHQDMQVSISNYIEEQNIYNAAALDSAIATLKEALIWG